MNRPRIDSVSGQFFRKGRCTVCGKSCERLKTFTGLTLQDVQRQGAAWTGPLRHKRCE